MRLTNDELLEKYPSWNTGRHDIGKVLYGDEPALRWGEEIYNEWRRLVGTPSNISALDAYIYTQYGDYCIYSTLAGRVYAASDGRVLAGKVEVTCKGTNTIYLNRMYGWNALDIHRIGAHATGFSNAGGMGSPSKYTREMDSDTIEKIVRCKMDDYGIGIQKFMAEVRRMYYADTTNYIMDKLRARGGMNHGK